MKTDTECVSPLNLKPVNDPSVDVQDTSNRLHLDFGEDHSRVRTKWWQLWYGTFLKSCRLKNIYSSGFRDIFPSLRPVASLTRL